MRTQQEKMDSMYFREEINEQITKCFLEFSNIFAKNVVSKLIDRMEQKQRDISRILETLNRLQVQYQKLIQLNSHKEYNEKSIKNHSSYVAIEQSIIEPIYCPQEHTLTKPIHEGNHEDFSQTQQQKQNQQQGIEQSELQHEHRSIYVSRDRTSVGCILKQQISKYPIGNIAPNSSVQRENNPLPQPSQSQSLQFQQILFSKFHSFEVPYVRAAQFKPNLYEILQLDSISKIDEFQSQNNLKYIQRRVQSWSRQFQFIKRIRKDTNNQGRMQKQGEFLFTVIQDKYQQQSQQQYYSIGFGGYSKSSKSARQKLQLTMEQNAKFFEEYKKYQNDFKKIFFVKRIMISNCLPIELFTEILNTEWTQLQEILYLHDNQFDDQRDFTYIMEVLSSEQLKHMGKLYFYIDLLTPLFAQMITEAELDGQIQIWVGKMPIQTYSSLKTMLIKCSNKRISLKFQIPCKQFNPKQKIQIITLSLMQLQYDGYYKQKISRLISLDMDTLNEKKNLIDIQWQKAKEQSLDLLILQQNSSAINQSNNEFHRFEYCGYTLTTYPRMNLTKLFTLFMWQQVTKLNFTQLHDSQQWRVFIQQSYRFYNLRIINLQNPWFNISKLKAQVLRGFKSLKYLIVDKKAVDMQGMLQNEDNQNIQTINKLKHLQYLCQLIPTLRIVVKTQQLEIQSESAMRMIAIKSKLCKDDDVVEKQQIVSVNNRQQTKRRHIPNSLYLV